MPTALIRPSVSKGAHLRDSAVEVLVTFAEAGIVQEVDVQVVGAEVFQGGFQLAAHGCGQVGVCSGPSEVTDLGGEHETAAGYLVHQVAEEAFGVSVAVHVGGVEQVDAQLVGGFQATE